MSVVIHRPSISYPIIDDTSWYRSPLGVGRYAASAAKRGRPKTAPVPVLAFDVFALYVVAYDLAAIVVKYPSKPSLPRPTQYNTFLPKVKSYLFSTGVFFSFGTGLGGLGLLLSGVRPAPGGVGVPGVSPG
jgi:hypothetical protein